MGFVIARLQKLVMDPPEPTAIAGGGSVCLRVGRCPILCLHTVRGSAVVSFVDGSAQGPIACTVMFTGPT
jgi:hypothetical protein